jgi:beta-phosphoglucomutase-like phosphatase (HAD superfamily)
MLNSCSSLPSSQHDCNMLRSLVAVVATALNIPMSQCLLVDDTPLNVDRAKAAGWQALLFSDAARLKRDLNDLLQFRTSNQAMQRTAPRSDA